MAGIFILRSVSMGRGWKITQVAVPALFSILSLMINVSQGNAVANVGSYVPSAFIARLPAILGSLLLNPFFLSGSFLLLGLALGSRVHGWKIDRKASSKDDWYYLGLRMSNMARALDNMSFGAEGQTTSELNVLIGDIARSGLQVPRPDNGIWDSTKMSRYLYQVGAYLQADQIDEAKASARQLAP
jgi:hypothetical protein